MSSDNLFRKILSGQGPILSRMRKQIQPTTAVDIGIDIIRALGKIENAEAFLRLGIKTEPIVDWKDVQSAMQYVADATGTLKEVSSVLTDILQSSMPYSSPAPAFRLSEVQDMLDAAERSLFDALTNLLTYIGAGGRDNLTNVLANVNRAIGYLNAVNDSLARASRIPYFPP